ncbi:MFS transporter [Thermoleophilia bacterium SCSIO 60948]|nr:MFS transporter [Thermoleophilia bacterium SCSIO 60948]
MVLALGVGVVLADSSIVTLALPEILARFDTSVFGVSWVLTAFNIVLALLVVPAAALARRSPRATWSAGLVVFALASAACAVAPSITVLIFARCIQAVGGAALVGGAIELLARSRGSHAAAAPLWGAASLAGLALGPAAGGLLTELLSWEAIFFVQVPLIAGLALLPRLILGWPERGPSGPIRVAPEVALGLLSAGLTGAIFLLVIMLTQGWGLTPLAAALVISAMPAATLVAAAVARRGGGRARIASGAILLAGGLAALGLLPGAEVGWTLAPQVLVGAGIALALPGLERWALATRDPIGARATTTIAARHVGVVVGIVCLTPVFSAQLERQYEDARLSGTAFLLDAELPVATKAELGDALGAQIAAADGDLPDLGPAFEAVATDGEEGASLDALEAELTDEVDRAATQAFSLAFLLAGALALAAPIPIAVGRRREPGEVRP